MSRPKIFISCSAYDLNLANILSQRLYDDAEVEVWSSGVFPLGKSLLESLDSIAEKSDFALFIVPNNGNPPTSFLFEVGFFVGKLGLSRTFLLYNGQIMGSEMGGIGRISCRNDDVENAVHILKKAIYSLQDRDIKQEKFYSCFISYSYNDQPFAEKLYEDLQAVGIRCWLDTKDLKIGESWSAQIDRAIEANEKHLIILSNSSIKSKWVLKEIESALNLEKESKKSLVFPIRIDDSIFNQNDIPAITLLKEKHIGDFKNWGNEKFYHKAFSSLVRNLM
ncbi:MAG: TIR domain-containing protein, partial [Chitinophagaceae bacterium]